MILFFWLRFSHWNSLKGFNKQYTKLHPAKFQFVRFLRFNSNIFKCKVAFTYTVVRLFSLTPWYGCFLLHRRTIDFTKTEERGVFLHLRFFCDDTGRFNHTENIFKKVVHSYIINPCLRFQDHSVGCNILKNVLDIRRNDIIPPA